MRLNQIQKRLSEINEIITKRSAELTEEEIKTYSKEVDDLKEERKAILETAEARNTLLKNIADGIEPSTTVDIFPVDGKTENRTTNKFETVEYRNAFMRYVTQGEKLPTEYRANEVTGITDAGALLPTTVLNRVVEKLEVTGKLLALITRTNYKGGVSIPKSTVKPEAVWVASGAGSDTQKLDATGEVSFTYHKLRCAVAVSLEVNEIALSAFESKLVANIVEAMTKAIEIAIINGTGVGQPKGILAETVIEDQKIEVSALDYKTLTNAEAALPQAYENNAKWCMSKKTFMSFIGMVDSNKQPIARENYGIDGKVERRLLGREVECCDHVTNFTDTLEVGKPFAFLFDFKDYTLNMNYNITLSKYQNNDTDDTVTKAIALVDGKVVDNNSLVVLVKKA